MQSPREVEEEWSCADIVEVDGKAGFRVNFKGEEVEISAEKVPRRGVCGEAFWVEFCVSRSCLENF